MENYEEDHDSEQGIMNAKTDELQGYSNHTQKKQLFTPIAQRKERWVIVVLLLVIIGLIAALIAISTNGSASSNENDKECEKKSPSISIPDNVTAIMNWNSAPCEDDWIWYRGKCYYFSTVYDIWDNSQKYCREHKASLALIDNKEELDFMFRFKGPDNHWIGLRRRDDNNAWTWINEALYNESLFPIKRSSSESIECVFLNHEGVSSKECDYKFKWICNKT